MFEESDCILVCYKLILSSLKLNVFFVYFQGFYSFYSFYGFHALEINKPLYQDIRTFAFITFGVVDRIIIITRKPLQKLSWPKVGKM